MSVRPVPLPEGALLQRYGQRPDCHTDCFETSVPGAVRLSDLIAAFYATRLFRLERWVLARALRRPITDAEVQALAAGDGTAFAIWTVEAREDREILLRERSGATRSYLAVADAGGGTVLRFGSAVVPKDGAEIGRAYRVLMPLHLLYSRALLAAAARRLKAGVAA